MRIKIIYILVVAISGLSFLSMKTLQNVQNNDNKCNRYMNYLKEELDKKKRKKAKEKAKIEAEKPITGIDALEMTFAVLAILFFITTGFLFFRFAWRLIFRGR